MGERKAVKRIERKVGMGKLSATTLLHAGDQYLDLILAPVEYLFLFSHLRSHTSLTNIPLWDPSVGPGPTPNYYAPRNQLLLPHW